ncbi:fibronectin type III domain-containing protein [Lactococcus garvieae]|uniref:fibronectin type III domain-containing protein n=1 Tax=Lactococcus garvieae TaxID=1363 RepID=UPI00254AAF1A|nr:fibronectin type III domain-containing protein [Lactococcus garvieae]
MADKNYLHTAYSNSADGTNGFTTVYPNLNLSTDTKLFTDGKTAAASKKGQVVVNENATVTSLAGFNYATFTSQGSRNQDWFRVFLIPDTPYPLMDKSEVLPNTKYTFSFFAKGTGTHRIIAYNNWAVAPNNFMDITLTSDWKLYTLTVTSMATIPTNNVQFFFRSSTAGSVISVMKPKPELGSIATPYMPSSSEVTTADWPKYVGTYVDTNPVSSTDPSKYGWDEMNYRIYLDGIAVAGSKLLSAKVENLKPDTSYTIQVKQVSGEEESDFSDSVTFKTNVQK